MFFLKEEKLDHVKIGQLLGEKPLFLLNFNQTEFAVFLQVLHFAENMFSQGISDHKNFLYTHLKDCQDGPTCETHKRIESSIMFFSLMSEAKRQIMDQIEIKYQPAFREFHNNLEKAEEIKREILGRMKNEESE